MMKLNIRFDSKKILDTIKKEQSKIDRVWSQRNKFYQIYLQEIKRSVPIRTGELRNLLYMRRQVVSEGQNKYEIRTLTARGVLNKIKLNVWIFGRKSYTIISDNVMKFTVKDTDVYTHRVTIPRKRGHQRQVNLIKARVTRRLQSMLRQLLG